MDVRPGRARGPRWRDAWHAVLFLVAGSAIADAADPSSQLQFWIDRGMVPDRPRVVRTLDFACEDSCATPLLLETPVVALAVHGRVVLHSERAFVRISVLDAAGESHLVGEFYPVLAEGREIRLVAGCGESCLLPAVIPVRLRARVIDAHVSLDAIEFLPALADGSTPEERHRESIRAAQSQAIVERIQHQIDLRGQSWLAGETAYSRLSLQEKIDRSPTGEAPALEGFEYYVGGVYERGDAIAPPTALQPDLGTGGAVLLVDRFDWREKHEAHRPGSPYYDGDPSGSGWMTPVAEQGCGDCWAFSTVAVLESLVNLSLNRHVDVNLSEQQLLSCSGAGDCEGGKIGDALTYAASNPVVSESCFPYRAATVTCQLGCLNPELTVGLGGIFDVPIESGEATLKRALLDYGPLTFGLRSWWHFMVLVGYEHDAADGETIWIVKNSFGLDWGEQGYGRLKVPMEDIYGVYAVQAVSLYDQGLRVGSRCRDADGDGYAVWGLNSPRPSGCVTRDGQQDCNDATWEEGPTLPTGGCGKNVPVSDPPPASTPPPVPPPAATPAPASSSSGGGGGGGSSGLALIGASLIAMVTERRTRTAARPMQRHR
jgi:hypothetical protein